MKVAGKRKVEISDFDKSILILAPNRKLRYKKGDFLMLCQSKSLEILKNKHYTGDTLRVLIYFVLTVEYDNKIKYHTQEEISQEIKVARPNVSKAIKDLIESGIIYKDSRDYYFSDEILIKGDKNKKK